MDKPIYVILVDKNDKRIGIEEKMEAHDARNGKLHRAISIFVFNKDGKTMLQQRTEEKYHSKGNWSNTCCSHPMPGEKVMSAAHRRLTEEMGFDCRMWEAFDFPYEADVGNNLREREYDHVIFGRYDKDPEPNEEEVKDWKWISIPELERGIRDNPGSYTPWLKMMINKIGPSYEKMKGTMK